MQVLVREYFSREDRRGASFFPLTVCANLPYYITSPLMMRLLESNLPFESITVMVQKEAAERLIAPMGTRAAGAVTAAVAYRAEGKLLFPVSRGSFYPAPNVDSAVIKLENRKTPPVSVKSEDALFKVIRAAFNQRRKTLLNSLSSGLSVSKEEMKSILDAAGVDPGARAETLTMEQFAAISDLL